MFFRRKKGACDCVTYFTSWHQDIYVSFQRTEGVSRIRNLSYKPSQKLEWEHSNWATRCKPNEIQGNEKEQQNLLPSLMKNTQKLAVFLPPQSWVITFFTDTPVYPPPLFLKILCPRHHFQKSYAPGFTAHVSAKQGKNLTPWPIFLKLRILQQYVCVSKALWLQKKQKIGKQIYIAYVEAYQAIK